jgi:hypothetical protein
VPFAGLACEALLAPAASSGPALAAALIVVRRKITAFWRIGEPRRRRTG